MSVYIYLTKTYLSSIVKIFVWRQDLSQAFAPYVLDSNYHRLCCTCNYLQRDIL